MQSACAVIYIVICGPVRFYHIFLHYFTNGTFFGGGGGGVIEHEMCVLIFSEVCICDITECSIADLPERTEESHEKFWTEQSVARSITSPPECKSQGLPFEAVCSVPTCGRRTVEGSINEEPTDSERHGPAGMLVGRSRRVACRGPAGIWHAPLGYRDFTDSQMLQISIGLRCALDLSVSIFECGGGGGGG